MLTLSTVIQKEVSSVKFITRPRAQKISLRVSDGNRRSKGNNSFVLDVQDKFTFNYLINYNMINISGIFETLILSNDVLEAGTLIMTYR